jgi:thiol:disulfide interchange protein
MNRLLLPLFCLLTNSLVSQVTEGFSDRIDTSKGINFENNLSWEQVKEKAKAENKYIFVDCYATWCGPCKAMDKEV